MPLYEQIEALNNYEVVDVDDMPVTEFIDLIIETWFKEQAI